MEVSADLGIVDLIFAGIVLVGGHGDVSGVLFCRWLPPLVVSG
jgi:hypothetical protein